MRKSVLAAVAALAFVLPVGAVTAEDEPALPKQDWSFNGVFGRFDLPQVQRGFQIYKEVCSSCHSLNYISFRDFEALGYSEGQIKALAAQYEVEDGPDDNGDMFKRKARPSDHLPKPFANDALARLSNNGALPPDLSLMAKAREGGPDYIYNLLLGYSDPPPGVTVADGMSYNKWFVAGAHQIAMPQQIMDDRVSYDDKDIPTTAPQLAKDVTAFLMWTAEPKLEVRHATGIRVMLYTIFFTVLAYFLKRRIWARLGDH
jgi:ubiquinol-cytochrome c reductase cytochrome c1 subunit